MVVCAAFTTMPGFVPVVIAAPVLLRVTTPPVLTVPAREASNVTVAAFIPALVLLSVRTPPVATVPTRDASNPIVAAVAVTWLLPAPSPRATVWFVAFKVASGEVATRPPTTRFPLKLSVLISYPAAGAAPAFITISEVPPFASMVREAVLAPGSAVMVSTESLSPLAGMTSAGDVRVLVGVGVGPAPPKNGVVGVAKVALGMRAIRIEGVFKKWRGWGPKC
jgi:hypothetical protein